MTFEHPVWLALTPLIALISIGLVTLGWRKRSHLLGRFAASRLLESLTEKASLKRRLIKSALIVAALGTLALALARPQYGVEWSERKARGLDIVFALDSSKSMLATDLRPNRLERAKLAILDLIDRLESDRVGLVAFAGQAFLQTPPTLDYGAFRESLDATDPTILSRGGSDLGRAIEEAAEAFPSENNVKVVVLLTDGEDLAGQAVDSAREAAEDEGIQVFTIGIGTPEGEYLRIRNTEGAEAFVRDADGQPVRSQLDESTLQEIARITGGSYSRLSGSSLQALYESVLATLPREERESEMEEAPIERFQWLLAAALVFLVLEMLIRSRRPGTSQLSSLLVALLLVSPTDSEAQPYNQAHAALGDGNYAEANELYTEAMQQTDDRALQRDALYNMGHATYQLGREAYEKGEAEAALKEVRSAEKLFESALELDPDDSAITQDLERTRAVRETIEKFLEQQKDQQQQDQQQQQDDDESKEREDQESDPSETQDDEGSQPEDQESQQQEQSDTDQQEQNEQSESGQQDQGESGQQDQEQPGEAQEDEAREDEAAAGSESEEDTASQEEAGQETPSESDTEESEAPESTATEEQPPEEEAGESQPVPEVGEAEEDEAGEATTGAADSADAAATQGMSREEAQVLLDSLRGKEEILPFAKPAPGNGRPSQDW
ncbi:MAG: VWA domain-containing protein [Opitutales bacterium]